MTGKIWYESRSLTFRTSSTSKSSNLLLQPRVLVRRGSMVSVIEIWPKPWYRWPSLLACQAHDVLEAPVKHCLPTKCSLQGDVHDNLSWNTMTNLPIFCPVWEMAQPWNALKTGDFKKQKQLCEQALEIQQLVERDFWTDVHYNLHQNTGPPKSPIANVKF